MSDSQQSFVLRADGFLHTADVRSVAYCTGDWIASASRDQTAQITSLHDNAVADAEDKDELVRGFPIVGHTAFVNFVFFHPGLPLVEGAPPCLITGSNDNHVAIWSIDQAAGVNSAACTLEAVLDGHAQGVCAGTFMSLDDASADGHLDLVTGDWGGVCIVFDSRRGRPKQLYTKHGTAVRGVAHLPHTTSIVSCSGDKTIHQWDAISGHTIAIYQGHEDVVQCICAIDDHTFATGSNDSTVRIWHTDSPQSAQSCAILIGHTSLVYTVAWHPATQELLTASEDRTVCVWGPTEAAPDAHASSPFTLRQAIHHPCVVWSVAAIAGGSAKGDIVTGGSDGVVRLWTRNDGFMASIEKLEHLEQSVSSQRMDVKVASAAGLDPSRLVPVHELHLHPGQREGERAFAKSEAGTIEVYVWSSGRWDKIGDVVAGPAQTPYTGVPLAKEKQIWNGVAYDYLFDVDVQGAMLKLPYNAGTSVLETARQFIADNPTRVSVDNLEVIQQFILEHIDPADLSRVPGLETHASSSPALAAAAASSSRHDSTAPATATATTPSSEALPSPWVATEVFATFKLDGALKKISDALAGTPTCESAQDVLRRTDAVMSSSAINTPTAIATVAELCAALCQLYTQLPAGSRFPASDALRFVVGKTQLACLVEVVLQNVGELLTTATAAVSSSSASASPSAADAAASSLASGDAETIVWIRLAACLVGAMAAQPASLPASAAHWLHEHQTGAAMVYLFSTLPKLHARAASAPMKAAITALVRNEVILVHRLSFASAQDARGLAVVMTPLTQWLISSSVLPIVAQRLACEPVGSPVVTQDLISLWTLYGGVDPAVTATLPWAREAKAEGKVLLSLSLRALATGADPQVRPLAKKIGELLSA